MSFPDDDGRAQPLATQMDHALDRGPRYRVGLGDARHPLIISDGRRIVHEQMTSVAAEGQNPVRSPSGNHVIARNEDDDYAPRLEGPHENRFAHRSQVGGDTKRLRLTLEGELCHLHHAALVRRFRGIEEIGARVARIDLGLEPVALDATAIPYGSQPPGPEPMKMVVASRQSSNSKAGGGLKFELAQPSAIMMQAGPQVNSVVW